MRKKERESAREKERRELAAEGLVSVKLSSSCMSDWPRLRPNVEYRQEGRKGAGEDEDVEARGGAGEEEKEQEWRRRRRKNRGCGHPLCLIAARGTKVNLTAITGLITATL